MLTSVHLLTGAAIGKATGNPWIAGVLSFIFHHVLDSIPHYNPRPIKGFMEDGLKGSDRRDLVLKSLEPVLAIIITLYLIALNRSDLRTPMVVGAFFGWLPDLFVFFGLEIQKQICKIF